MRFENQVALVTGAASGIGRALVGQLVAEGAAVVAVDLVEEALQQVVSELQAQGAKATGVWPTSPLTTMSNACSRRRPRPTDGWTFSATMQASWTR